MSQILSVGTCNPPHQVKQAESLQFAKSFFQEAFSDIERLLEIFQNGQIETRYVSAPLSWFTENHTFQEKNDLYIKLATQLGREAIEKCLGATDFLTDPISPEEIDAIIFVSTTGLATPSIDAKIMNQLPFSLHTKRMPLWGLGCAGGAAGLSKAHEYCLAFPKANVLVVSVELCSLTFQANDFSKSNLVGTSLFADGAACVLVSGDQSNLIHHSHLAKRPFIRGTQSTLMPDSEDVMGWDIKNEGLYVVFSKSIPAVIESWLKPNVEQFLMHYGVQPNEIDHFVAHPGGKKVLKSYQKAFAMPAEMTKVAAEVMRDHGNMSSPTVLFVLREIMKKEVSHGDYGLAAALGPGFCSELLLFEWGA